VVGNDEVLLDAFVSIKPDKDFLSAIDNVTDAAIKRMQEKFGAAVIKGPNVSGSQASGQPNSSLEASAAQAESRREASARRILEITKQIEAANIDLNSGTLEVSKVTTLLRLEKELVSATDQEAIAKKEVLDLNAQILAATQQQIAQQNALTAATQATAAVSQQQIDKLDAEIDRVNKKKEDAFQVKSDAAAKVGHAGGKDASDAYLRANQEFLRVEDELNKLIEERRILYAQLTQQQQAAAAAAQAAANPPGANPPANPPGANPPANPPGANPPGANPPGGPTPPNLAAQFNGVTESVRRLQQSLTDLSFFKVQIKTEESKREFESLRSQIADIKLFIQEADVTDPFALNEAITRAGVLQQRMNDLRDSTYVNRSIKETFNNVEKGAKEDIAAGRRREERSRIETGTISDGRQRQQIALATLQVREQEQAVLKLLAAYNGTAESVDNVILAVTNLITTQDQLDTVRKSAKDTGASFNNLSNNAYQAGQAIEDFAVGYSLNGIAGGVRGAANNVAFLLNSLAQSDAFTSSLAGEMANLRKNVPAEDVAKLALRLKNIIPLAAGIGSALAILVLPKLIEWLESLNDIEAKFNDIADVIKRSFEDVDFEIGLGQNNTDLLRTVNSAESVLDVLKAIQELSNESSDIKGKIQQIFAGFTESGDLAKATREISELQKVFTETINGFQSSLDNPGAKGLLDSLLGSRGLVEQGLQETLDLLKPIRSEIVALNRDINEAVTAGAAGNATPDQLKKTEQQIFEFRKKLKERTADPNLGLDFSDTAGIDNLDKTLEVIQSRFKAASDEARTLANIVDTQVQLAFDAAARKVTELQDQLDLSRAVALDINVDFDLDLLALDAQINEGRRILTESIGAIRESAKSRGVPVNEAGIKTLEEEFKVRSLLSVEQLQSTNLKEREKLEERILELKEKQRQSAKFTTLEEFAKNLQINALSGNDEEKRRKKRLEDAQREREQNLEDFRRIQEARGAINDGQGFGDAATRPRVPQGSAGTGFQPFFGDIMRQFTESALNFQQPDNQQLKPEDIKQAVSDGVREGMKVLSEGFGGKAVDALKNLKGVAVTQ
jgi:hypothetical protein